MFMDLQEDSILNEQIHACLLGGKENYYEEQIYILS